MSDKSLNQIRRERGYDEIYKISNKAISGNNLSLLDKLQMAIDKIKLVQEVVDNEENIKTDQLRSLHNFLGSIQNEILEHLMEEDDSYE